MTVGSTVTAVAAGEALSHGGEPRVQVSDMQQLGLLVKKTGSTAEVIVN